MDHPSPFESEDSFELGADTPLVYRPQKKPQVIAAIIVTIGAFGLGNVLGWSSTALPNLEESKKLGPLSLVMKSWIESIVNLGMLASGLATAFAMDRFGRRMTLLTFSVPFSFGWILIACSQNFTMMLIGRFITGFFGGSFTAVVPVYISEVVQDSIRGMLSSVMVLALTMGILFTYIVGSLVSWFWLSIICATIPAIAFSCMSSIPESPRYLLAKGYLEKASLSLKWLRGASHIAQVEPELILIQKSIEFNNNPACISSTVTDYISRPILKPIGISLLLMFFQQFAGINAVIFHSVDIFKASGFGIGPNIEIIIVGFTQVLVVAASTYLVDKSGRRILLIISETGIAISLISLGIFFSIKEHNDGQSPENLEWLPLISLIAYMISYNIALGSIPWVIAGEILPLRVKALATALVASCNSLLGFIVTKNFIGLSEFLGTSVVLYIFGVISAFGVLYAVLVVPETKGKSLDEIQALFMN